MLDYPLLVQTTSNRELFLHLLPLPRASPSFLYLMLFPLLGRLLILLKNYQSFQQAPLACPSHVGARFRDHLSAEYQQEGLVRILRRLDQEVI